MFVVNMLFTTLYAIKHDIGDAATTMTAMLGIAVFMWCVVKNKQYFVLSLLCLPVFYAILRSAFNFVPGYTAFEIAKIVGFIGIILLTSMSNKKIVYRSILLMAVLHLLVTYFVRFDWELTTQNKRFIFGVTRSYIRYSTIIYAGLLAAYYCFKNDNKTWKIFSAIFIPIGLVSIFHAYSNTLLTITVLTIIILIAINGKGNIAFVLLCLSIAVALFFTDKGFSLDGDRLSMWKAATLKPCSSIKTILFGYGVGFWPLLSGSMGLLNAGHPHSELLNIFFDQGLIGIFVWVSFLAIILVLKETDYISKIGVLMIVISTLTNSARYPYIFILIAVFCGLSIHGFSISSCAESLFITERENKIVSFITVVMCSLLLVVTYEQWRSDKILSELRNEKNMIVYGGLYSGWSLESRYCKSVYYFKTVQNYKKIKDNLLLQCKSNCEELTKISKIAPGYKNINEAMVTVNKISKYIKMAEK